MHEELRVTFFVSSRVNVVTFITCPSDESVSSFMLLALEATINKALGFFLFLWVDFQVFKLFRPADFSVFFLYNEHAGELRFKGQNFIQLAIHFFLGDRFSFKSW